MPLAAALRRLAPARCSPAWPPAAAGPRRAAPPTSWSTAGSGPATPPGPGPARVAVVGRHGRRRGRQRRDRRAGGPGDSRAGQRRRDGRARLHGRPPALHRRRIPARQRRPAARQLARGIHRPAQGVRHRAAPGRVDPGRRLGPRALARRAAPAPGVDRLGDAEQPGLRLPPRRPHGAGQLGRASAGQDRTARTRDIPGGVIVRDPVRASRPASSRTRRWSRSSALVAEPTAAAARRGAAACAGACRRPRGDGLRPRERAARPTSAPTCGRRRRARSPPVRRSTSRSSNWRAVADTVARLGRGDDWVWIGGVKGYVDGSLGSTTALFYAAVRRRPVDPGRAHGRPRTPCAPGSARRTPPACRSRCTRSASAPTGSCSTSTTASPGRTGSATAASGSSTPSTCRREDIARFARSA